MCNRRSDYHSTQAYFIFPPDGEERASNPRSINWRGEPEEEVEVVPPDPDEVSGRACAPGERI
jgi:hypothetical protein